MENIVSIIENLKLEKNKVFPCYTNRASEIGHPCLRYLIYCRTNWQDRVKPNLDKLLVFDEGNLQEWKVIKDLTDAGIRVLEQGISFGDEVFFKKHQISGKIDGKLEIDGKRLPLEIKSMSPFIFQAINEIADMTKNKNHWVRKYPAQMCIYLLGSNQEQGIFLLKNKSSGKLKQLVVNLDYQFAEELIKKADLINDYIAKNVVPDGINDDNICSSCDFNHICMPDKDFGKTEFVDMGEIKTMLDRREELLKLTKELDIIKETLTQFQGQPDVVISDTYRITGKWIERKEYSVKACKYWQTKIERINGQK